MEDNGIIELFFRRSERAITETAEKYGNYCHSISYNILSSHEDAQECVNDTYLAAWNSIPPKRPSILSAFLGRITRNISINLWKKNRAGKRGGGEVALALEELSEFVASGDRVEQAVEAAELSEAVNEFVTALPDDERRVFVCRYWYLDPIEKICREFDFSESKVKTMLHRTRQKLLKHLKKEGLL